MNKFAFLLLLPLALCAFEGEIDRCVDEVVINLLDRDASEQEKEIVAKLYAKQSKKKQKKSIEQSMLFYKMMKIQLIC